MKSTAAATVRHRVPPPDLSLLPAAEYAYLLGVYLGDGHVARVSRSFELRIACDSRYPLVLVEIEQALAAVSGGRPVRRRLIRRARCVSLQTSWPHWPRVLPQCGPGRKHERVIELTPWQRDITHMLPESLVRGLIHSDGSRFIARQRSRSLGKHYRYPRYTFSNRSDDIKRIFCEHLLLLGVEWTVASAQNIQIARRESVATLDRFVGPKR